MAAAAQPLLGTLAFPGGHAGVLALGALLMLASAASFVSAGEPPAPAAEPVRGFGEFLRGGLEVLRGDRRFRLFLGAQWCGGAVAMALPFYVLEATRGGALGLGDVAYLVAAQTTGALLSNPLWGWLGDRRGKLDLLRAVAALGAAAPALTLAWLAFGAPEPTLALAWFALVFLVNGAVDNGRTIGYLGYLMEISPDHRRPAYSGYFNSLVAPVWLLPIAAAALAEVTTFAAVFAASLLAAGAQVLVLRRLAA